MHTIEYSIVAPIIKQTGLIMPVWATSLLRLRGASIGVYSIIHEFTHDGNHWLRCSMRQFSELVGVSQKQVSRIINTLLIRDVIKRRTVEVNGIWQCEYQVIILDCMLDENN